MHDELDNEIAEVLAEADTDLFPEDTADAEDELTLSAQSHDEHFLDRTMRCAGPDLDRAMRLYHHSDVVRRLLPELMSFFPTHERAAIPLREAPPSPHVIVSRDGGFVTCLGAAMAVGNLPRLPYTRFAQAMDRADAEQGVHQIRLGQLKALPWIELYRALGRGPGHVTREMAEIIARSPETYILMVVRRFALGWIQLGQIWALEKRLNRSSKRLAIEDVKVRGTVHLCCYLLSGMHHQYVLDSLLRMLRIETCLESPLAYAVSMHQGGGEALLNLMEDETASPISRRHSGAYLIGHVLRYPDNLRVVTRRYQHLPLDFDGWEATAMFLRVFQEGAQAAVDAFRKMARPQSIKPKQAHWLFYEADLISLEGMLAPFTTLFPPAEQAAAVKLAWDKWLRGIEPWSGYKSDGVPIVRTTPRVGRNEPCPCSSGRKFKLCCQGRPAPQGPSAEEIAAKRRAEREAWVAARVRRPIEQLVP